MLYIFNKDDNIHDKRKLYGKQKFEIRDKKKNHWWTYWQFKQKNRYNNMYISV